MEINDKVFGFLTFAEEKNPLVRVSNISFEDSFPELQACDSAPCLNNGSCIEVNDVNFVYACRDGFYGITCEQSEFFSVDSKIAIIHFIQNVYIRNIFVAILQVTQKVFSLPVLVWNSKTKLLMTALSCGIQSESTSADITISPQELIQLHTTEYTSFKFRSVVANVL